MSSLQHAHHLAIADRPARMRVSARGRAVVAVAGATTLCAGMLVLPAGVAHAATVVTDWSGLVTAVAGIAIGPGTNGSGSGFGSLVNAGALTVPAGNAITVPAGITVDNDTTGVLDLAGTLGGAGTTDNAGTIQVESGGDVTGRGQGPAGTSLRVTPNNFALSFDTNGGSGTTPIPGCGSVPVSGTGTATCTADYATVGSHAITAAFTGDAAYAASTSATTTEQVAYGQKVAAATGYATRFDSAVAVVLRVTDAAGANLSGPRVVLHAVALDGGRLGTVIGATGASNFPYRSWLRAHTFLAIQSPALTPGTHTLTYPVEGDPTTHTLTFTVHSVVDLRQGHRSWLVLRRSRSQYPSLSLENRATYCDLAPGSHPLTRRTRTRVCASPADRPTVIG